MKHASGSSSFKRQQLSVDVFKSDWGLSLLAIARQHGNTPGAALPPPRTPQGDSVG